MKLFKKFARSTAANVSIMFGLAAVPLIGAAGVALDFMQGSNLQAKLLSAADSAGLAAASSNSSDIGELRKIVADYLKKNGALEGNFTAPKVTVVLQEDGSLKVDLTTKMNTGLMRVVGRNTMDILASTVISREIGDMDIALVLDNTGSMAGRKMTTLKSAAKELVETLHDSKTRDSVIKIGLVPFSDYVNIGMGNRDASWADIPPDSTTKVQKTRWRRKVIREYDCRWENRTRTRDGVRTTRRVKKCKREYGPRYKETYWKTTRTKWSGCVGSRNNPWNTKDERTDIKIPGIMDKTCSKPLTELTDNESQILNNLKKMRDGGSTYIPAGLMWGWRVVSAAEPFANKVSGGLSTKGNQRAIVLMTDGENTVSPTYPKHTGNNKTTSDKLTTEICENIKSSKEKITVYTVAFEVKDTSTQNMLRSCATSPSHYFDADNSAELTASFQTIAKSLAQLRIAQ